MIKLDKLQDSITIKGKFFNKSVSAQLQDSSHTDNLLQLQGLKIGGDHNKIKLVDVAFNQPGDPSENQYFNELGNIATYRGKCSN